MLNLKKTYDRYFDRKSLKELTCITGTIHPGPGLAVDVLGAVLLHILKKMDAFTEVSFIFPLTPPSLESEMTYEKARRFFKSHRGIALAFQEELHAAEKGLTITDRQEARKALSSMACPLMLALGESFEDPIAECFFAHALKTKNYWAIVKNYPRYKEFQYRLAQVTRRLNSVQFLGSFFEESKRSGAGGINRKEVLGTFRSYVAGKFGRARLVAIEKLQAELARLF